jgi:hypothetical protein
MRHPLRPLSMALGMAVLACGDSPSAVQLSDLVGAWTITTLEFREQGGTARVDLIGDRGATATMTVESDGTFSLTVTEPGLPPATDTGTITLSANEIVLAIGGDSSQGTIARDGDTVTMDLDGGVEFDFDEDGVDEAATLRLVMVTS